MTENTTSAKPKTSTTKTAPLSAAIRDEVIASVKQAQQFTLDSVSTWVEVVGKTVPELPHIPFVPTRTEVVDSLGSMFEFTDELFASQRKFAAELANLLVPAS
ncbi:MAG: hypothetical protein ABSA91_11535 [Acidimicrobiales bacterium]|jgi:hypothetical protein